MNGHINFDNVKTVEVFEDLTIGFGESDEQSTTVSLTLEIAKDLYEQLGNVIQHVQYGQ